jgi:hypothetical protein
MRRILLAILCFLGALPLQGQTAGEVLERHIAALGGRERLAGLKSLMAVGTMKGMGTDLPFKMFWAARNRLRIEISMQGNIVAQVFDGTTAGSYLTTPSTGYQERLPLTPDEARDLAKNAADLDLTEFLAYDRNGGRVDLQGRQLLEGREVFKIRWTKRSGDTAVLFIDSNTFLEVRRESLVRVNGVDYESESRSSDYREVSGLMMAFRGESRPKGASEGVVLEFAKFAINPQIPESAFAMP